MKKHLLLFGALISLMACSQVDTDVADIPLGGTNITLGLPNTRTSLGEKEGDTYPIYWSEEDKIVVNGAVSSSIFIAKNRKSATFNFANDILSYPYCITYPYTKGSSCTDGSPTVVFATEQHFVEGTFGVGVAPMCGYCESEGSTSLKHLAGVLRLAIKGSSKLADIEISAAEDVALSGEFSVDCQSGTISAIEGKVANKLTYVVNQTLSTTEATVCHIVVPTGNFGACKVLLTDDNGEQMTLKWNASDVKAGVVREFKAFTFTPSITLELEGMQSEEDIIIIPTTPRPANNEIWYTNGSTTSKTMPYYNSAFNTNIVSNTYDTEKECWVIKFSGELTLIKEWAFYECDSLTSITIPDGVTSIGERAFYNCTSLTSVTIGNGVTSIGISAFSCCESLTSVTIPNSVASIGDYAFHDCTSLTSVTIPNSVTSIGEMAFINCISLTSITIPDSVTSIGYDAFSNCTSLTSVTIGNRVTAIVEDAFNNCTSLTSVTIPDSVTSIGKHAFNNCTSLTSITIPNSITSIGNRAFNNCTSLTSVYYTGDLSAWCKISLTNISANPLNNGAKLYLNGVEATDITIPSDITEIKNYTFHGCSSLTSVTIPDSVTSIGNRAFYNCTSLASVTIGNRVTSIGYNAFDRCTSLTNITIPDSVTSIGSQAFYDCTSLASVTIGNRVTSIGYNAFVRCTSLKEVYCKPTTPPTGDTDMFYGNASGRKIYVPTASVDAYKSARYWSNYASDIEGYDF